MADVLSRPLKSLTTLYRTAVRDYPRVLSPVHALLLRISHSYRRLRYQPAESVLDNMAKIIVNDLCVTVPEFQGEFYLDPRSALFRRVARDCLYEPDVTDTCMAYLQPDRDVIDIGANVGFYTVLFSRHLSNARVLAVEPTAAAYARLVKNIEHNQLADNVLVFNGAASDTANEQEIKVIAGREEFSSLGEMAHQAVKGQVWNTESVVCETLDNLVSRFQLNPGLIKIDVEGMEHLVLAGGSSILRSCRPVIVAELSDHLLRRNGASAAQVLEMLQQLDYRVLNLVDTSLPVGNDAYGEILCLPG